MLYFVKLSEEKGAWANPEEAEKLMNEGCAIYEDDSMTKQVEKIIFDIPENKKNKGYERSTEET